MEDILELKPRRQLFSWIKDNPGCHQREIQRGLDMPTGQINYHLDVMVKKELLAVRKDGNYARYYPRDIFTTEEKVILGFLRRELPRGILLFILLNPDTSQKTVAKNFRVSEATVSYHLSRMTEAGVLSRERAGKEMRYRVNWPDKVAIIVIAYRQSFLDSFVDVFSRIWVRRNRID